MYSCFCRQLTRRFLCRWTSAACESRPQRTNPLVQVGCQGVPVGLSSFLRTQAVQRVVSVVELAPLSPPNCVYTTCHALLEKTVDKALGCTFDKAAWGSSRQLPQSRKEDSPPTLKKMLWTEVQTFFPPNKNLDFPGKSYLSTGLKSPV